MKHFTVLCRLMLSTAALILMLRASPASANNCLKDEFGKSVTCTANDVKIAKATNIRALDGTSLKSCNQGSMFSFVADFIVVTTATARENIGLYFATAGQSTALTGTCSANIIAPLHMSSNPLDSVTLGTGQYQELDASPDNCGDISTSDNNQVITVEVDNVVCQASPGTNQLALPDCTSWQQPGGTILCQSPPPYYPWVSAAIPGSPSKCNCDAGFTVPITVQSASLQVTKTPAQSSLSDPGGSDTYTVVTTNTSNFGNVTINQICDDKYGNIATALTSPPQSPCAAGTQCTAPNNVAGSTCATNPSCQVPTILAGPSNGNPGQSLTCTFTGNVPETGLTDNVTVNGVDGSGNPVSGTATATVTVTEASASAAVVKTSASAMPTSGCATVRYNVEVDNKSGLTSDETETLSALTDTTYGNIAAVQGNVLGTTCGASGLGTLAGSAGGGVLPFTIPVGGKYTCQFDAKVCGNTSALSTSANPPNLTNCPAGLEVSDTISGTLLGDESEAVTQTPGSLTVDVCFATTEVTN